jgi:hypothetical protein
LSPVHHFIRLADLTFRRLPARASLAHPASHVTRLTAWPAGDLGSRGFSMGGGAAGPRGGLLLRMLAIGRNLHAVFTRSPRQFHLPGADCCYEMLAHPNSRARNGWSFPAEATGSYPHKNRGRAFLVIQAGPLD